MTRTSINRGLKGALLGAVATLARAQPLSSAGKSCGWWKPHVQLYAVKGFCQFQLPCPPG